MCNDSHICWLDRCATRRELALYADRNPSRAVARTRCRCIVRTATAASYVPEPDGKTINVYDTATTSGSGSL